MALEITTVGAKVVYQWEATAGSFPSGAWNVLEDVNEAPDFDLAVEVIDASNITDKITRYALGRQDPGGDAAFTLNHTDAAITEWKSLVTTDATNFPLGKRLWFAYVFEGAADSFYWAGRPTALGSNGVSQNVLNTIPAHCVVVDIKGWDTKPSTISA